MQLVAIQQHNHICQYSALLTSIINDGNKNIYGYNMLRKIYRHHLQGSIF